jgi:dihydrofolate reductase
VSTRFIYRTATSLDGFIADPEHSLAWLFAAEHVPERLSEHDAFLAGVGALVMGGNTYRWVLDESDLLTHPGRWQEFHGERPTFVFTTRESPRPDGADVRLVRGEVGEQLDAIVGAADGRDVWVVGGGELAGRFHAAGALDQLHVSIAPVTLGAGAPLLPRRIESARLQLEAVRQRAQFIEATYRVSVPG